MSCIRWTGPPGRAVSWVTTLAITGSVIASCAVPPEVRAARSSAAGQGQVTANAHAAAAEYRGVEQPTSAGVPVTARDPVHGDPDAPVTVVMFTDLECPYCSRGHQVLTALRREYDVHTLRIVVKHSPLPFHAHAHQAARTAQAVYEIGGADQFIRYLDQIYGNQSALSGATLLQWAEELGLPRASVAARAASGPVGEKIALDLLAAERLGVTGTPNFRINGIQVRGAQPLAEFRSIVQAELAETQKLTQNGVPRAEIYARRVTANHSVSQRATDDDTAPDPTVWRIPVTGSPSRGPEDAPVTVVGFLDFECSFCVRAERTLIELGRRYPEQIRFVFKQNPLSFHKHAMRAAMFVLEARKQKGDAGFWAAAERLWRLEGKLDSADWEDLAGELGLNAAQVKRALATEPYRNQVEADRELAADFDVRGAPNFFINGRRLEGAQPLEEFAQLVEQGLAQAKELRNKGIAPANIYPEILKTAEAPRYPERRTLPPSASASPSRGPLGAPVEVHVFSDFQCPFCERLTPTLEALELMYPKQVRLVFHQFPLPFHGQARDAASAALEAYAQKDDAGFWAMHDLLFKHQEEGGLERDRLVDYGTQLGLDSNRLRKALEDRTHSAAIDADIALGKAVGVDGTPAVLVNGYFISGAQPLSVFKRLVRHCLEERAAPAPKAPEVPRPR